MPKKFTLKPIEAELKTIRSALEKLLPSAPPSKKKALKSEIKKLTKLIKAVPAACKKYSIDPA